MQAKKVTFGCRSLVVVLCDVLVVPGEQTTKISNTGQLVIIIFPWNPIPELYHNPN